MAGRNSDQIGARRPLKVLHVIPSVSRSEGGPSYAVKAFAAAVKPAGVETMIVATADAAQFHSSDQNENGGCMLFRRNVEPYKISFSLRRWLKTHVKEFDLLHIHSLFSFSSRAAAAAASKKGVPYIIRPLGVLNQWGLSNRRPLLKKIWLSVIEIPLLRRAAAVHYTTESEREEAKIVDDEIARLKSFVVPIPVATRTTVASPQDFLRSFPALSGKKLVLFLARLDEKKGLDLLLEAFASVKNPDAHLVIAGDGRTQFVAALHQKANSLGLSENVTWTGFLNEPQKAAAFSAATIFVLPSYSENFGIAAAEALAAGVPTILSDQVAIAHDVDLAKAAVVVPTRGQDLAAAIARLLSDAKARDELGRNGKLAAQRLFSPERVSDLLVSEYRKILGAAE